MSNTMTHSENGALRFALGGLARVCIWLVALIIVGDLLLAYQGIVFNAFLTKIDSGALYGTALLVEAENMDALGTLLGYSYIALWILTAIVCAVWIYRASWNARQIQPSDARITPGWSVGWFFIPIATYWKPYEAMVQTWNSSHTPTGNMNLGLPGFAKLWWVTWVIANIAGSISFRMWRKADTIDLLQMVNTLDLIIAPISILSSLLFIRVIKSITAAQADKAPALPPSTAPDAPPVSA